MGFSTYNIQSPLTEPEPWTYSFTGKITLTLLGILRSSHTYKLKVCYLSPNFQILFVILLKSGIEQWSLYITQYWTCWH